MCHELARTEGLMVGGSAGLNTFAAVELANNLEVIMTSVDIHVYVYPHNCSLGLHWQQSM